MAKYKARMLADRYLAPIEMQEEMAASPDWPGWRFPTVEDLERLLEFSVEADARFGEDERDAAMAGSGQWSGVFRYSIGSAEVNDELDKYDLGREFVSPVGLPASWGGGFSSERRRRAALHSAIVAWPFAVKDAEAGHWDALEAAVATQEYGRYELQPLVIDNYLDRMGEERARAFLIGCFMCGGDSDPSIRDLVRALPKRGRETLPEEVRDAEMLEVWRAGSEPIDLATASMSWTLRKSVAEFFLDEYGRRHAAFLYKGEISPDDVIEYTDERDEAEVLQYFGVKNVELVREAEDEPEGGFYSLFDEE